MKEFRQSPAWSVFMEVYNELRYSYGEAILKVDTNDPHRLYYIQGAFSGITKLYTMLTALVAEANKPKE